MVARGFKSRILTEFDILTTTNASSSSHTSANKCLSGCLLLLLINYCKYIWLYLERMHCKHTAQGSEFFSNCRIFHFVILL